MSKHRRLRAAQQYRDIALARYQTGVDTYLNVLTAQDALLNNQLSAVTVHQSNDI
jgi:outer membrane protein TolC